jgi:peptide chain release factor 1
MNDAKNNIQNEIDRVSSAIEQNKKLLETESDEGMKKLYQEEIERLNSQIEQLSKAISDLDNNFTEDSVTDGDSNIDPNVAILEIRAGTGGLEASLFAHDLFEMYTNFAEKKGWKVEKLFFSEAGLNGIKTASLRIRGQNVYELLKNESGVHRVQRVPVTESGGRIHTSAATIAILPELKKVDIEIRPEDVKLDFFRSGGSGGQNVNKVSTAVRVTHIPTGVVIECQEERTQGKNREKAMSMLESRLYTIMKEQNVQKIEDIRSSQVGTGDRSEKIRTYNFPQDRITDHRIGKNWHNLVSIMGGNIDSIIETCSKIH